MKSFALFILFFLSFELGRSQNLIGFDSKSIKKYMKENHKDMAFEKVVNPNFKYLKFSDNSDTRTIIFFLGSDSVCKSERLIINKGIKAEKIKEFNTFYKAHGENRWIDKRYGKDYLIEIKDEPWYSVVTIIPDK